MKIILNGRTAVTYLPSGDAWSSLALVSGEKLYTLPRDLAYQLDI